MRLQILWLNTNRMTGALALIGMLLAPASLHSQTMVTITVEDSRGAVLQGATVTDSAGALLGRSDYSGRISITCSIPCTLRVNAPGFVEKSLELSAATVVQLVPAAQSEQVTVTAYRSEEHTSELQPLRHLVCR